MANNTFKIIRKAWYPQEKDFGYFVCGPSRINIDPTQKIDLGRQVKDAKSVLDLHKSKTMKNYSILIHPKREDGGGDYKVILRRYIVKSYDLKGASIQAETIVKPGETFSCQEQNPKQIEY